MALVDWLVLSVCLPSVRRLGPHDLGAFLVRDHVFLPTHSDQRAVTCDTVIIIGVSARILHLLLVCDGRHHIAALPVLVQH